LQGERESRVGGGVTGVRWNWGRGVDVGEVLRERDFDFDTDIDGIDREGGNGKSSTPIEFETVSRSSPHDVNSSSRAVTRSTSESGDRRF
jgi:hypothetical protein